jgi:hypothetical protein
MYLQNGGMKFKEKGSKEKEEVMSENITLY